MFLILNTSKGKKIVINTDEISTIYEDLYGSKIVVRLVMRNKSIYILQQSINEVIEALTYIEKLKTSKRDVNLSI